jgi:hypothetical protein
LGHSDLAGKPFTLCLATDTVGYFIPIDWRRKTTLSKDDKK